MVFGLLIAVTAVPSWMTQCAEMQRMSRGFGRDLPSCFQPGLYSFDPEGIFRGTVPDEDHGHSLPRLR